MSNLPRPEAKGLRYTAHAKQRMAERVLSERIVSHAVAWGIESVQDDSGQVRKYELQMSGKGVSYSLVVIVDGLVVVTAYIRLH
jgi:hypothetical protein